MSTAAEIVHRAIRASGLGEPWCSGAQEEPDAVRVGNQLMLVETDCATGEAMLTKYVIAGGAATAVEVIAHDYGNAVRRLTSWLREAGQPMVWTRENPGLYRSGKYLVGQLDTGEWFAEGPGSIRSMTSKQRLKRPATPQGNEILRARSNHHRLSVGWEVR
ncbi:hypothetical protein OIO89_00440 (plasmid) [Mycobacterium ulcerans]|nr:hypothetical protein OIO89_00440 [Mycobacterium ulcerans]